MCYSCHCYKKDVVNPIMVYTKDVTNSKFCRFDYSVKHSEKVQPTRGAKGGLWEADFPRKVHPPSEGMRLKHLEALLGVLPNFFWGGNPMQIQEKRRTFPEVSHGLYESQLKSEILRVL